MRWLALPAALLAFAVWTPLASAKIVLQKSIGGVSLGSNEATVLATTAFGPLGRSNHEAADPDIGPATATLEYDHYYVVLVDGAVVYMYTTSKKEKTANGVHVGVTQKVLKKKVKGLKCTGHGEKLFCYKGGLGHGQVSTGFNFNSHKKVVQISLDNHLQ